MKFHPACKIFPVLEGPEFDGLVKDISDHGLREPILVDEEGQILDGRNRYRACQQLKLEPQTKVWRPRDGDSELALVVSLNIKRRHLTPTLRAVLAAKLEPTFAKEAKERMQAGKSADGSAGGRGRKKNPSQKVVQGKAAAKAAEVTGANRQYVADVKALEKNEPDLYDAIATGKLQLKDAKAEVKKKKKAGIVAKIQSEPLPMPEGPFRVIVIDPPWAYESRAEDSTHRSRNPYPDMTLDEIRALDVPSRAADDSILWLWTTNAFMREAFTCLDAWGFEHKTILTWVKKQMGTGDWLRGATEHCLMAVRGKPVVTLTNQTTALVADRSRHSAKPTEFYELVANLCPGSKLAMFERQKREGWVCWGAETG